jgi:hypothetical protein
VEYLGGFRRSDVLDFLTRALEDLTGRQPTLATIDQIADEALGSLESFNGIYPEAGLETVVTIARARLLAHSGGGTHD